MTVSIAPRATFFDAWGHCNGDLANLCILYKLYWKHPFVVTLFCSSLMALSAALQSFLSQQAVTQSTWRMRQLKYHCSRSWLNLHERMRQFAAGSDAFYIRDASVNILLRQVGTQFTNKNASLRQFSADCYAFYNKRCVN